MRPLLSGRFSGWPDRLALGLPVLIAIALMAPRILDAHLGLFDDPASVSVAEQTWAGTWDWRADLGYGRFRPVYWLSFSAVYGLAGKHAAWYFVANLVLLAGTTFLLSCIVLGLTQRPLAAGVTGTAFVLGGPVVEAAYTLSKPELLQCFFLTASGAVLALSPRSPSRAIRASRVLLASGFILLAALTKETTGLMLAIVPAWLAIAWLAQRMRGKEGSRGNLPLLTDFLLAAGLGTLAYALAVLTLSPTTISGAGPQANFTFAKATIAGNARIWLGWLVRDWLYLLPLFLPAAILAVRERRISQSLLVPGCLIWMGGWLGIYLPYRFTPEYYLLPFSLGTGAISGVLAMMVVDAARRTRRTERIVAVGSAGLAVALFALTLPNNLTNAGIQLSVDKANSAMLELVAETAPQGGKVLVNIRGDYEYLWQLDPMLRLVYDRPDLAVAPYLNGEGQPPVVARESLILSPLIENVPYPSVRLGIPEMASREWEASLWLEQDGHLKLVSEVKYGLDLLTVDVKSLPCLIKADMGFCAAHTPFDTRRFAAGWRVYSVR
jgi:hypothetical protein